MDSEMKRYQPPPPSPPQIHLRHIPMGYPGTERTVEHMQSLIRGGAKDFYVRQKAVDILLAKGVKPKDYLGEIKALFEWVQANVRYTKDPFRLEVLHSARRMLELRSGDCDDMAILLGAMLEAIGHPVRLVLVGRDPSRPRLFVHVYLEAYHKGRWIPLDPTMPHPMGWSPPNVVKKVVPIERKPPMVSQDMEMEGLDAAPVTPDWLEDFVRAVGRDGLQPRDERVKRLWTLLKRRRLLDRSPWLQRLLRYMWRRGLLSRPRPRVRQRVQRLLRRWGVLAAPPARVPTQRRTAVSARPMCSGAKRP